MAVALAQRIKVSKNLLGAQAAEANKATPMHFFQNKIANLVDYISKSCRIVLNQLFLKQISYCCNPH